MWNIGHIEGDTLVWVKPTRTLICVFYPPSPLVSDITCEQPLKIWGEQSRYSLTLDWVMCVDTCCSQTPSPLLCEFVLEMCLC